MQCYPSAGVSDAMAKTNTMDPGIKPVVKGLKLIGKAYTVKCYPCGIITCHKALNEVPAGSVLVIDGDGDPNGALWGELTSMEAMQKKVVGVVVDGAVRDIAGIERLGFPVFARHVTPRVGSNRTVGTTGESIICGGVIVNTGDLIIGDDDGVVVIQNERIEEVLAKADAIETKEATIAKKITQGAHIADLIGMSSEIEEAEKASHR